jgi:hypothetical protein
MLPSDHCVFGRADFGDASPSASLSSAVTRITWGRGDTASLLASASWDGTVRVASVRLVPEGSHDVRTRCEAVIAGQESQPALCVALDEWGNVFFGRGFDVCTSGLHRAAPGHTPPRAFGSHAAPVSSVVALGGRSPVAAGAVLSASWDGTARLWDARMPGRAAHEIDGSGGPITDASVVAPVVALLTGTSVAVFDVRQLAAPLFVCSTACGRGSLQNRRVALDDNLQFVVVGTVDGWLVRHHLTSDSAAAAAARNAALDAVFTTAAALGAASDGGGTEQRGGVGDGSPATLLATPSPRTPSESPIVTSSERRCPLASRSVNRSPAISAARSSAAPQPACGASPCSDRILVHGGAAAFTDGPASSADVRCACRFPVNGVALRGDAAVTAGGDGSLVFVNLASRTKFLPVTPAPFPQPPDDGTRRPLSSVALAEHGAGCRSGSGVLVAYAESEDFARGTAVARLGPVAPRVLVKLVTSDLCGGRGDAKWH